MKSALLERSKLSRLPRLPKFTPPNLSAPNQGAAVVCVNCGRKLKAEPDYCQKVKVCSACLGIYTRIDNALNYAADMKMSSVKLKKIREGAK